MSHLQFYINKSSQAKSDQLYDKFPIILENMYYLQFINKRKTMTKFARVINKN